MKINKTQNRQKKEKKREKQWNGKMTDLALTIPIKIVNVNGQMP